MLAPAKSGAKTIGIWSIVGILAILVCPLVSLIQSQEAYAKGKKVSGTSKLVTNLISAVIPGKTPVKVTNDIFVLNSTDPAWNNATLYEVTVQIDPAPGLVGDVRIYSVITHPGGDQSFIETQGSWKGDDSVPGYTWSYETKNGMFVGGTGKFEGISAIWKSKLRGLSYGSAPLKKAIGEWEVQYYKSRR